MVMILSDGPNYQVVPLPERAIPELVVEKYPGWIFVADASTKAEADSKIERDRARRKAVCW